MGTTFSLVLLILMLVVAVWMVVGVCRGCSGYKLPKWKPLNDKFRDIREKRDIRTEVLLWTGVIVICLIILVSVLTGLVLYFKWTPIKESFTWMPSPLIAALFAAPLVFWLWLWRDQNKIKDQKQKDEEILHAKQALEQTERKLVIEENNDAWANFSIFQKTALKKEEPDSIRTTAIYAIGEYYERSTESNFPYQVHEFFKAFLNTYWMEYNNKKLPLSSYIAAIYRVISQKRGCLLRHQFDLEKFNLSRANMRNTDMSDYALSDAKLINADLTLAKLIEVDLNCVDMSGARLWSTKLNNSYMVGANLSGANLTLASLNDTDMSEVILSGASLQYANLSGANLSNANNWEDAKWNKAKYNNETKFPDGMNPEFFGMVIIDDH